MSLTSSMPTELVADGVDMLRWGTPSVPYLVATRKKWSSYYRYAIIVSPDPRDAAARVYRKTYYPALSNKKFQNIVRAMTLTSKSGSTCHYRTRNRRRVVAVVDPVDVLLASMPDVTLEDRFKRETRLRVAWEPSRIDTDVLRDIVTALRALRTSQVLPTAFLLAIEMAREQLCDSS